MRPSISTRHRRHEPKLSKLSVAQSLGIAVSTIAAARMIEVPAGTETGWPSMVSDTVSPCFSGVPKSFSRVNVMSRYSPESEVCIPNPVIPAKAGIPLLLVA